STTTIQFYQRNLRRRRRGFMRLMSRDCLRGLWHQQGKDLDTTKPLTKVKGCCGRRNFAPKIQSDFRPQSSG
ncbi:hypothetical protein, partial [uncultured Sulfitobacter sp.]|uniref:hypothetical protein n=1 Tax=uncultured Sulfitobacter sp. TaxID=191468 RepID=UPI0030FB4701